METVFLSADGWIKEIEINGPESISGYLRYAFKAPIRYLFNENEACNEKFAVGEFVFKGKFIGGKRVFEAEI